MELENLSTEILHHICLFVRDDSFHDLSSLRQASRKLFSIVAPVFYRNLIVHWAYHSDYGTERSVSELHNTGLGRHYLKARDPGSRHRDAGAHSYVHEVSKLGDMYFDDVEEYGQVGRNYHLRNPFPETILNSLRDYHPFCKLNILGNQFVTLNEHDSRPPTSFEGISYREPFQLSILDFPNLEGFTLYYPWKIQGVSSGYVHGEYFMAVARAPNLKHLRIWNAGILEVIARPEPETNPTFDHLDRRVSASMLESLVFFSGCYQSYERILLRISTIFDLSRLRSLEIPLTEDMALLGDVAPTLHNLERLPVTRCREDPEEDLKIFRDESRVVEAILSFRPLKGLRILVIRSFKVLHDILLHHGKYLESLIIEPSGTILDAHDRGDGGYKFPPLDCQGIRELARLCPKPTELRLQITRPTGGTDEYDAYRAFGGFPSLHTLFIDLQCDPRQQPLDIDADPPYEQIFRNAATDEALEMTIWDTITSHKVGKELRNLRCTPFWQPFYTDTLNCVLFTIGKSLLVKRLDSQGPNSLEITAIGEDQRRRRVKKYVGLTGVDVEAGEDDIRDGEIRDALSRIWPGNWMTSWHSFLRPEIDQDV